jgi:hypothetical protein
VAPVPDADCWDHSGTSRHRVDGIASVAPRPREPDPGQRVTAGTGVRFDRHTGLAGHDVTGIASARPTGAPARRSPVGQGHVGTGAEHGSDGRWWAAQVFLTR